MKCRHSAWSDLTGGRRRYRIVNMERLLQCLRMKDEASFRKWHRQAIECQLQCDRLEREKYWSTAVAVGDRGWLTEYVAERKLKRHRIIEADNAHYLQGAGQPYAQNR